MPVLVNKHAMLSCTLGMYKVHWEEGGASIASIGQLYDGSRWMACANWTSPAPGGVVVKLSEYTKKIKGLELILSTNFIEEEGNDE